MNADTPCITLHRRRAQPFFFRHPWVFSGAVQDVPVGLADGSLVAVTNRSGDWIGRGFYNSRSQIRVRLFSWDRDETIDEAFWRRRLAAAIDLRHRVLGLTDPDGACRLVYSDSDGFPGLVVDRYGGHLVIDWGSLALYERRSMILGLLAEALEPTGILSRCDSDVSEKEGIPPGVEWVHGAPAPTPLTVRLGEVRMLVDLEGGQKTGLYLDQRENHAAVLAHGHTGGSDVSSKLAPKAAPPAPVCLPLRGVAWRLAGMRVLDGFCYVGGFGLAAAAAGAAEVIGFDTSEPAIRLANEAARLNGLTKARFAVGDVFGELRRLRAAGETFDAVILDPPRFAASRAALPRAARGYKDINLVAMQVLKPGGLLVTCSCSQHVSSKQFLDILNKAAKDVARTVQVIERRGQAADHPVLASCPETAYLKCFVCVVR